MIQDIKDLQKLFKLCRAQGVTEFEMSGLKIKFGDLPVQPGSTDIISQEDPVNRFSNFPQGELTPEQLIFYSSGGRPEDDPYLKEASSQ